ncbi:hypothetical protein V496_00434 [Pseudogymnoascus sp. VKM F-4515 (FW-2607)]|nr:hypothetical protein V496_00434 [Pseudogymnoascus sp. VKM F-4515 (FW-2607)]
MSSSSQMSTIRNVIFGLEEGKDPQQFWHAMQQSGAANKRLSQVGDAAASLTVWTQWFPTAQSRGAGDKRRQTHLSNANLARRGRALGIDRHMRCNAGTEFISDSMIATTMEALLGAAFYNGGLDSVAQMLTLGDCLTGAGSASPLPNLSSGLVLKMNSRAHGAFPWVQDFTFKSELELVLICTRCKYALVPGTIASHLSSLHKNEVTSSERRDCVDIWKNKPLQPARDVHQLDLPLDTSPIPTLALFYNGMRCRLCTERPYICGAGNTRSMRDHLKTVHSWKGSDKGGCPSRAVVMSQNQGLAGQTVLSPVIATPVSYQTFYRSSFTRFLLVVTPLEHDQRRSGLEADQPPPPTSLKAQVESQLAERTHVAEARAASTVPQWPLEHSAWL